MNRCATEEYTHHYVRSRLPFDPTYGYNKAQLQEIRPPADVPHDFEAFWRATFSESLPCRCDSKSNPLNLSAPVGQ
jgi:cephalosporin-C deacetylase-like acetyl esterase